MTNFQQLYDNMEEYVHRRDEDSYSAKRIALEVGAFKVPNLLEVLPPGFVYRSAMEVGCGTGEIIGLFPGPDLERRVGYDISPLNTEAAQKRFPAVDFRAADFRTCQESFDLVILSDVLEHVEDDAAFLRDAARLGKVVLVNLPLEKCLSTMFRKYGPDDPSGHLRKYSLADGLALLQKAGLEVIAYRQRWSFEGAHMSAHKDLRQRMQGQRFEGGRVVGTLKAVAYGFLTRCRPVGRKVFASNLFAAARTRTGDVWWDPLESTCRHASLSIL